MSVRLFTSLLLFFLVSCNFLRDNIYDPFSAHTIPTPIQNTVLQPKSYVLDRIFEGAGEIMPGQMAVYKSGAILATVVNSNQVWIFSEDGSRNRVLGRADGLAGSGNDELSSPRAIATDRFGSIYIADGSASCRIRKFDSNFVYLMQWGSPGLGNNQFSNIVSIAISQNGNVVVADRGLNQVKVFDSLGTYLLSIDGSTSTTGFSYISSVCIDSFGAIYVADTLRVSIQKFNADGSFAKAVNTNVMWDGVTLDSKGILYAVRTRDITRFDRDGSYSSRSFFATNSTEEMVGFCTMLVAQDMRIYISDMYSTKKRITRYRPLY